MRQKVWRICLPCCQWWSSSPGGWPKQLQEDIHRTFCGPAELHRDFAIRVSRKDTKPVHSLCPKGHTMILVVQTLMLRRFLDPALLRHLEIVMRRDTGQFFECRSSAQFFLFRGQNDGDCLWLPMTHERLQCSSRKQKTYVQCSPQPETSQSHILLPLGVSSNLWTEYLYGDRAFPASFLKVEW